MARDQLARPHQGRITPRAARSVFSGAAVLATPARKFRGCYSGVSPMTRWCALLPRAGKRRGRGAPRRQRGGGFLVLRPPHPAGFAPPIAMPGPIRRQRLVPAVRARLLYTCSRPPTASQWTRTPQDRPGRKVTVSTPPPAVRTPGAFFEPLSACQICGHNRKPAFGLLFQNNAGTGLQFPMSQTSICADIEPACGQVQGRNGSRYSRESMRRRAGEASGTPVIHPDDTGPEPATTPASNPN